MQDCGIEAAVFGWRWLVLYVPSNPKSLSRAMHRNRALDNYRTEGTVPESENQNPLSCPRIWYF